MDAANHTADEAPKESEENDNDVDPQALSFCFIRVSSGIKYKVT